MTVHRPRVFSPIGLALLALLPTPQRAAAEVDDVYALTLNPGGLAFVQGTELRLLYGAFPLSDPRHGLGVFGAFRLADALVLAGSFEDLLLSGPDEQRYRVAAALPLGRLGLGVSFDHYSPSFGVGRSTWSTGLTWRFSRWAALGGSVLDWGQNLGPRQYVLGLAVRPGWERLTLAADWRPVQGVKAFGEEQHLAFRAAIEVLDGVELGLGLSVDHTERDTLLGVGGQLSLALWSGGVSNAYAVRDGFAQASADLYYRSPRRPNLLSGGQVVVVDLEGDLEPGASFSLLSQSFEATPYGRLPLQLEQLTRSRESRGLYVRIGPLDIGWGRAQELRRALAAYARTGRRVDCYLGGSGDVEYYLASACTEIVVVPAHQLAVNGVAANALFFGETLERVGVKAEAVARGRYKSAPEQLTRAGMSEAHRESLSAFLDRVYAELVGGIAEGRKLDKAEVEALLARGTLTSSEAKAARLVDQVLYPDEVEDHLGQLYGGRPRFQSLGQTGERRATWGRPPRVAVVHVDAEITSGESRRLPFGFGESAGAQTLVDALDAVRRDPSVLAVVLRVDSPGGDALASDLIARAVALLADAKPVVASFGDLAASGGYYVAAPARVIYAEPTTLTGSIGVFMLRVSAEGLLGKLGVGVDSVERGPLSNAASPFRDLTPEGRAALEHGVDEAYARFVSIVGKGRKLDKDKVLSVAEGRIWSGIDAKERGLVDELGGLAEAMLRARREAGLADEAEVEIVTLPLRRTAALPFGLLGQSAEPDLGHLIPHGLRGPVGFLLQQASAAPVLVSRLPFVLDID